MRKKLLRLLWVAPVAMLLFADAASAQSTGTIVGVVNDAATGKPVAGALVIATSKSLQGEQTAVTDARGAYTLTALPPGIYKLSAQLQGFKPAERSDINLRVDFTLRANIAIVPEAVQMEEQVVRTGTAPAVNIGSAEAGTIVSREFLAAVPTTRTFEQVATIAPTAQNDGFGVSFAGATSPENNYIIDGLRVSDPNYGQLGTNILTNFIDQLDLKVGSFMPEYGYSTAGVVNVVTKSGGNEFHGSIWGNLTPGLFTPSTPATFRAGEALASQSTPYKGSYNADFGVEVGGPIVKDKLWFYAGFAPRMTYASRTRYLQSKTACVQPAPPAPQDPTCVDGFRQDQYGQYIMKPIAGTEAGYGAGDTTYFMIGKLTWLVNENHNIALAANSQPTTNYGFTNVGAESAGQRGSSYNSTNATVNYTGKFLDKHLLAQVTGGWYSQTTETNGATINGINTLTTPTTEWQNTQDLSNFIAGFTCPTPGGCVATLYRTGGRGAYDKSANNRYAGNFSLTGLFDLAGQHQLKGGVQVDFSKYANDRYYTGGGYFYGYGLAGSTSAANNRAGNSLAIYRAYGFQDPNSMISATRSANICSSITTDPVTGAKTCNNQGLKDANSPGHLNSDTQTWSNGFYLQDSWTIANVLTLNFGVRLDQQTMRSPGYEAVNPEAPSLSIMNEWAPRVQAIWDFTGTGRGKIQANWGLYFESIPLDMASRAFGSEVSLGGRYQLGTCSDSSPITNPGLNPFTQCPNVYGLNGPTPGPAQGPGPNTITLTQSLASRRGFSLGSQFPSVVDPNLKGPSVQQFGGGVQYEILQDLTLGVEYLGRRLDTAVEDMSSDDGSNYFIANPGKSAAWTPTSGPYSGVTLNAKQAAGLSWLGVYYATPWPDPVRSYDGFTITLNKLFSKRWLMQASYTWSSLRGNYGGLFRTEDGQLDPNLSSDFDLIGLQGNKSGPLGLNRTNQIKAAGSYNASLSPDVSLVPSINFQAYSGVPVNALAAQAGANGVIYGDGQSYLLPMGSGGVMPWMFQLDLGAKVIWALSGPYSLQFSLDLFNILNMQTAQWVDNNWTFDSATPMQNAQCAQRTATVGSSPIRTLQDNCPDLAYARTVDDRPINVNLNYGQPTGAGNGRLGAYQLPISARFGVQLTF
jgi:hypothetical protein